MPILDPVNLIVLIILDVICVLSLWDTCVPLLHTVSDSGCATSFACEISVDKGEGASRAHAISLLAWKNMVLSAGVSVSI